MMGFRTLCMLCVLVSITACTNLPEPKKYSLVIPGIIDVNHLQVENISYWSQQINGKSVSWTRDGVLLNEVVFSEINDGQDILGQSTVDSAAYKFDPDTPMHSLVELFVDALSVRNFHNVRLLSDHPLTVNGKDAIIFKIIYDSKLNVSYTAQAIFIKHKHSLHTIYGSAPTGHIFNSIEAELNQILYSVRLKI